MNNFSLDSDQRTSSIVDSRDGGGDLKGCMLTVGLARDKTSCLYCTESGCEWHC